jgi:hypothetical protein
MPNRTFLDHAERRWRRGYHNHAVRCGDRGQVAVQTYAIDFAPFAIDGVGFVE